VAIDYDVAAFQMNRLRIGILKTNGDFRLREPDLDIETLADDVVAFQITYDKLVILKSDHSLWAQWGRKFKLLAENVTSFQLYRQYVAYVQDIEGEPNRLMVAEWSRDMEWFELAHGVVDFEMEVIVEPTKHFPSKVHLAVADTRGQLLYAESANLDQMKLQPVNVPTTPQKVRWASACLAVHGDNGDLVVSNLDTEGKLGEWTKAGAVYDFRINNENVLALSRSPHELRLVRGMLFADTSPTSQESSDSELMTESCPEVEGAAVRGVIQGFDWASEELVADGVELYCLSSIKPDFVRRPIYYDAPRTDRSPAAENKQ
jgi:hypothetical protein